MHLLAQFERCRAWLHAAADLDQQRIIELLAQARQRVTDSRLGAADPLRRSRHAALRHQRLENDEQVEIDLAQIDFVHGT